MLGTQKTGSGLLTSGQLTPALWSANQHMGRSFSLSLYKTLLAEQVANSDKSLFANPVLGIHVGLAGKKETPGPTL